MLPYFPVCMLVLASSPSGSNPHRTAAHAHVDTVLSRLLHVLTRMFLVKAPSLVMTADLTNMFLLLSVVSSIDHSNMPIDLTQTYF